jgi:hypothetical protein
VIGTGSLVEAHLVSRLGLTSPVPNLRGCGVTPKELKDLVQEVLEEQGRLPLLLLVDSVASDQDRALMRDLRRRLHKLKILLLVQDDSWINAEALAECQAQAIVQVQSFGNGTLIRALQTPRWEQRLQDPLLQEQLQEQLRSLEAMTLSNRSKARLCQGLACSAQRPWPEATLLKPLPWIHTLEVALSRQPQEVGWDGNRATPRLRRSDRRSRTERLKQSVRAQTNTDRPLSRQALPESRALD